MQRASSAHLAATCLHFIIQTMFFSSIVIPGEILSNEKFVCTFMKYLIPTWCFWMQEALSTRLDSGMNFLYSLYGGRWSYELFTFHLAELFLYIKKKIPLKFQPHRLEKSGVSKGLKIRTCKNWHYFTSYQRCKEICIFSFNSLRQLSGWLENRSRGFKWVWIYP